uniref:Mannosyltransferase n=1 Tax=Meloidogyne hapla TaxID=6305 RepID=A0A1I8C133_MELHA
MFSSKGNFLEIVVFRLCCCFFSNTWFVPDEYFQSVEVAYHMVYGKGHLAWEWLPEWALRSPLHPLIYALFFWLLKLFSLDFAFIIRWIPNIIHAFLFAIADICFINWAKNIVGYSQNGLIHQRGPYVANTKIAQYVDERLQKDSDNTIYVLQLM